MSIEWNKVTWYSKLLAIILFVLTFCIGFSLGKETAQINALQNNVVSDSGNLTNVYENSAMGFSIHYPLGFTADDTYQYQELGPGKDIDGVKFTIPQSITTGTNLNGDSYISVEEIPQASECSASLFLGQRAKEQTAVDGNTTYSMATLEGAAAGNRYDETVYAIPGANPCIAVRYFIHYGVIENYPPGAVKQFDEQALLAQFDSIRRTLVITS